MILQIGLIPRWKYDWKTLCKNNIFVIKSHGEKLLNTASNVVVWVLEISSISDRTLRYISTFGTLTVIFGCVLVLGGELELFIWRPAFNYLKIKIR